jgi:hypothetical protein
MVNDFPILGNPGQTLLFSDDEAFHVLAEDGKLPWMKVMEEIQPVRVC